MGKPFDIDLAKHARSKELLLVSKLNGYFKRLRAELGPGKNTDITIKCLADEKYHVCLKLKL